MLDLAKVLQFIKDSLDQGMAAHNGFLEPGTRHGLHVFLERGEMSELKVLPNQCIGEQSFAEV